jgi:preprotein translocase subunit SecY
MKKCPWCAKEYPDDATICAVDGNALEGPSATAGPSPSPSNGSPVRATDVSGATPERGVLPVWRKAMVTGAVLAACWVGGLIPLPTIAHHPQPPGEMSANWSVMVLGVSPLLSAFILVEFAALLVPAWQPLRVGGPTTRGKLRRAALILGLVLTAGQALLMAIAAEHYGIARDPGLGFRLLTVVTLLGSSAVLFLLAQQVDRQGLGSGFSILILALFVPEIIQDLGGVQRAVQSGAVSSDSMLKGALIIAGLVAATLWMFSSYRLPVHDLGGDSLPVRRPACGFVPLTVVWALLLFLTRLAHLNPGSPLDSVGRALRPGTPAYLMTTLLLNVAAVVLFSWLFNQPDRVADAWRRFSGTATPAAVWFKPVLLESSVFIVLIVLGESWLIQLLGAARVPSVLGIVAATGIVLDLTREARAHCTHQNLVPVWEIHQLYAVDPALRLLASEGIPAFPRGVHHRTLLQFFGPYVPIHVLVEPEHAERAQALLRSRLPC